MLAPSKQICDSLCHDVVLIRFPSFDIMLGFKFMKKGRVWMGIGSGFQILHNNSMF